MTEVNLEPVFINSTGNATLGNPGSFMLAPGGAGYPGGAYDGQGVGAISIIAATAGHKFSAIQW